MFLEKVRQHYVLAGISDIVYHYTSLSSAMGILKENQFALTFIFGADDTLKPGDKYYYLSTTQEAGVAVTMRALGFTFFWSWMGRSCKLTLLATLWTIGGESLEK